MISQVLALLVAASSAAAPVPDETPAPGPEAATSEPAPPPEPPPRPRFTESTGAPPADVPTVQLVRDAPDVLRDRLEWHEKRDAELRNLTLGFGVSCIAFALLGGPLIAASPNADTTGTAKAMTGGGAAALSVASALAIGTIVTGVVLGNHRNLRGFFL